MKNCVYTKALLTLGVITLASPLGFANTYKDTYKMNVPVTFTPYWYAGANIGVSRTHDRPTPGLFGNSVTQIGPGWSADLGYAFYNYRNIGLAAELGYTQYYDSYENAPGANIAYTKHFAAYLAGVAAYPLPYQFGIFGKLGVAYSYAKKIFVTGASASANVYSPYYGLGVSYNIAQNAAILLQWARARGNGSTGSTDLTSLGITYAFI